MQAKKETVTILHTNDIHGRHRSFKVIPGSATSQTGDPGKTWHEFEREGMVGGFATLATAVTELRKQVSNEILLVDGGDTIGDDLLGNLTRGEAVISLMNALGYNMMVLGNHDFDYGAKRTQELQQIAKFPMRGANVIEKSTGKPFLGDPCLIFKSGNVKIGLLAISYHNTAETGSPKNLELLEFTNGIAEARKYIPLLREQADIVVVISHQGTNVDRLMAETVEGIDLIIGGHSHDNVEAEKINKTWIVQAVSDSAFLGETVLEVGNGNITNIKTVNHALWTDAYPPDPYINSMVERLRAPYREQLEEEIATAAEPIGRNYRSESPFDKLTCQIMCKHTEAEIAFLPGIGYGVTLLPGSITREMLYTLIPHPAKLVTLELTGKQTLEILEQCATNQKPKDPMDVVGGLVQTSGIQWTVDFRQPIGKRIRDVKINAQPLGPENSYKTVINTGLLNGLHRYTTFQQARNIKKHDIRLNSLVEQYMREMKVISAPEMGEITIFKE